jgi:hypothetical protein
MLTASLLLLFALFAAAPAKPNDVIVDFRDLTIKTRVTMDSRNSPLMIWYFKGSRMRSELRDPDATNPVANINIYQCDRAVRIFFNESSKTYHSVPADPTKIRQNADLVPEIPLGGEVTVTTDSVDTGERRPVGSYEARRVRTTITVEPGPETASRKSKTEIDGWYLDLPGLYCQVNSKQAVGWSTFCTGRCDRVTFKRLGTAPRGFAVEETTTKREYERVFIQKIEFLEISEKPLDESLFDVPPDYSLAPSKSEQ